MAGMFPIDFAFNRDFQKCMDILVAAGASAPASGATKLDPETAANQSPAAAGEPKNQGEEIRMIRWQHHLNHETHSNSHARTCKPSAWNASHEL